MDILGLSDDDARLLSQLIRNQWKRRDENRAKNLFGSAEDYDLDTWEIESPASADDKEWKQRNCFHLWKEYVGFTEVYIYCEKCDKKKV